MAKFKVVFVAAIGVVGAVFAVLTWQGQQGDSAIEPAGPVKRQAPQPQEGYWTEERMQSATPAPMPTK